MDFLSTMPLLNLTILGIFIVVIVLILVKALKGKKLKVGNTEITDARVKEISKETRISEREIIKRQIHISRAVCAEFKTKVPHYDGYDIGNIENVCFRVSDEMEDLILFNHISEDDDYINSRFPIIWSVISDNLNDNFTEEDTKRLKDTVFEDFKKLIKVLLAVRKERE